MSHPVADLSKQFKNIKLKGLLKWYDSNSKDEIKSRGASHSGYQYERDQDEDKDLTTCDSECGYCGKCPY